MENSNQKYLVILMQGTKGLTQACFAFNLVTIYLGMGITTNLYLFGEAVRWANKTTKRTVCMEGFETIQAYFDSIIKNGGGIFVCRTCYEQQCLLENKEEKDNRKTLLEGVKMIGMVELAEMTLQSKVYTF